MWGAVIAFTSGSAWRLVAFGTVCCALTAGVGTVFSNLVVPAPVTKALDKKKLNSVPYDERRTVTAREVRLSSMIRDMVEGRGDHHWTAAMRGTLAPHPEQENKTQGVASEALAKAAAAAAAAQEKKKGWWS